MISKVDSNYIFRLGSKNLHGTKPNIAIQAHAMNILYMHFETKHESS